VSVAPPPAAPDPVDQFERIRRSIDRDLDKNPGLFNTWVAGVEIIGTYEAQFLNWLGIPISLE